MNKTAIRAGAVLKALGYGGGAAALATGAGALGHRLGVRSGAERMGTAMSQAFTEANTRENQAIVDAFKAFNKRENQLIARNFLQKGYEMGQAKTAELSVEDIRDLAFEDELEKLGFNVAALKAAGKVAWKALKSSFGRLGKKLPAIGGHLGQAGRATGQAIREAPLAAGTIGSAGLIGGGYMTGRKKPRRTIVEHRSS